MPANYIRFAEAKQQKTKAPRASREQCGKTSAMGPVDSRRKDNRTAGQQAVPRKPKGKGGRAMGASDAPKVPGTQSVGLSVRTAH